MKPFSNPMPLYLANNAIITKNQLSVQDKYSDELLTKVSLADKKILLEAVDKCVDATHAMASLSSFERKTILKQCLQQLEERQDELAFTICKESGKSITDATREVKRTISTFQIAMEEASRIYGEVLPIDLNQQTKHFSGMWKRFPIGPSLFITPFNFPLNLVAHKVAPALAVGCPFIVKPSGLTPLSALILGEILSKTDLPKGAFSILPCETKDASILVTDDRLKLLSFTGSAEVGWKLKTEAGKKVVILELGGNAACIVDESVNIDFVASRLIWGAYYQAGQSCISVQRIFAHKNIYESLKQKMLEHIQKITYGDPSNPDVFMGPMISEAAAKRVEDWIQLAVKAGAKLLCGGKRQGALLDATLLENVSKNQKLYEEEAFGPVAMVESYEDFELALKEVNNTRYGLQAGVFTNNLQHVHLAWNSLAVGGVIINEVPSFRSDAMPYGGIKDSGLGREGVRFAMDHLTELKMLVINNM